MKIILMVNDSSAEKLNEVGIEQWCRENAISPLLMVMRQEGQEGQALKELFDGKNSELLGKAMEPLKAAGENPASIEAIMQGPICLYPKYRRITVEGKPVELKNKEFELLLHLIRHAEEVYSKEELHKLIWGPESGGDAATVTVHINRIRKKIEKDPANPRYLQTVWGAGYRFQP